MLSCKPVMPLFVTKAVTRSSQFLIVLGVWLTWVSSAAGQGYTIRTVAGGTIPNGTPATAAGIGSTRNLAIDANGNIFFAIPSTNVVMRIDKGTGLMSVVAGTGGQGYNGDNIAATSAELAQPTAVAVDSSGNLYIEDSVNQRIRMVSNGIITTIAGNGTEGYNGDNIPASTASLGLNYATFLLAFPGSFAVDSGGSVYFADTYNNRVRKISNGIITTVAGNGNAGYYGDNGPAASAGLFEPTSVALDPATGNLYIADFGNNVIREVSNGAITTFAGTGFSGYNGDNIPATTAWLYGPNGVAVDASGNVYIADTNNNRIREVSNGTITSIVSLSTGTDLPTGIALDSAGNVYIADIFERLGLISNGSVTTIAGNGTAAYNGDNISAVLAQTSNPNGVALDAAGNLYFADSGNQRVREVSDGTITTFAGNGNYGYQGDNGPPTSAEFKNLSGLAVDASGNVYIADTGSPRVRKVSNGIITTFAGNGTYGYSGDGGPATSAQLTQPQGMAADTSGNVYIADTQNHCIRKVSNGTITTFAGTGTSGYNGDNIPATSAQLNYPYAVAVDAGGNVYIADSLNSRIRKVTNGTITTVAGTTFPGTGYGGYNGDNIPATSAWLFNPQGVAVDAAGNIFIADTNNNRIRMVSNGSINTIAGTGTVGYNGDNIAATTALLNTPEFVTVDKSGDIYFSDTYNFRVRMLVPAVACVTSLSATSQSFPAAGGSGSITVTAPSTCSWSVTGAPSWLSFTSATSGTGDATVTYEAGANSGTAQSGTFTIGGLTFTAQQASGVIPGPSFAGVMAQIASGDGWDTELTLLNTGSSSAEARVNLWGDPGSALVLPFTFPQMVPAGSPVLSSALDQTIAPNALLLLDSQQPNGSVEQVGSAQLLTSGSVSGFATFLDLLTGQEAVVPLETVNAPAYVMPYDNTGGLATGVAVANVASTAATIPVILRDDTGAILSTTSIQLAGYGHTSFMLNTSYAVTESKRGTAEFDTPSGGQISVLGLRASPIGTTNSFAVTTLPALANVTPGSGSMAQVAAGSGWQTSFALVNVGTTAANAQLSFFDNNGVPWTQLLTFPQSGTSATESVLNATIQPNQTLLVVADTGSASVVGSAQLTTTGNIGAFTIFHDNLTGQEAAVPLEIRNASAYLLAYENTNGISTGVAVANVSNQSAAIPVILRDDTGVVLGTSTLNLPANGHTSFILTDPNLGYPVTAGKRGTVEFDTPTGGQISIVGLRATPIGSTKAFAVTTVPPLVR